MICSRNSAIHDGLVLDIADSFFHKIEVSTEKANFDNAHFLNPVCAPTLKLDEFLTMSNYGVELPNMPIFESLIVPRNGCILET